MVFMCSEEQQWKSANRLIGRQHKKHLKAKKVSYLTTLFLNCMLKKALFGGKKKKNLTSKSMKTSSSRLEHPSLAVMSKVISMFAWLLGIPSSISFFKYFLFKLIIESLWQTIKLFSNHSDRPSALVWYFWLLLNYVWEPGCNNRHIHYWWFGKVNMVCASRFRTNPSLTLNYVPSILTLQNTYDKLYTTDMQTAAGCKGMLIRLSFNPEVVCSGNTRQKRQSLISFLLHFA